VTGYCESGNESKGFYKRQGTPWHDEGLLASQEIG
jgi:hypothetical protein